MADPKITRIEVHEHGYTLDGLGRDYNGFNLVYAPGGKAEMRGHVPIPQKPGLGAEIDWDWVNKNSIGMVA
jgi:L-alanine-DL-glutamate epimerase-like enolase superfamily enzyme